MKRQIISAALFIGLSLTYACNGSGNNSTGTTDTTVNIGTNPSTGITDTGVNGTNGNVPHSPDTTNHEDVPATTNRDTLKQ